MRSMADPRQREPPTDVWVEVCTVPSDSKSRRNVNRPKSKACMALKSGLSGPIGSTIRDHQVIHQKRTEPTDDTFSGGLEKKRSKKVCGLINAKSIGCIFCGRQFAFESSLALHLRENHAEFDAATATAQLSCGRCGDNTLLIAFRTPAELSDHLVSRHPTVQPATKDWLILHKKMNPENAEFSSTAAEGDTPCSANVIEESKSNQDHTKLNAAADSRQLCCTDGPNYTNKVLDERTLAQILKTRLPRPRPAVTLFMQCPVCFVCSDVFSMRDLDVHLKLHLQRACSALLRQQAGKLSLTKESARDSAALAMLSAIAQVPLGCALCNLFCSACRHCFLTEAFSSPAKEDLYEPPMPAERQNNTDEGYPPPLDDDLGAQVEVCSQDDQFVEADDGDDWAGEVRMEQDYHHRADEDGGVNIPCNDGNVVHVGMKQEDTHASRGLFGHAGKFDKESCSAREQAAIDVDDEIEASKENVPCRRENVRVESRFPSIQGHIFKAPGDIDQSVNDVAIVKRSKTAAKRQPLQQAAATADINKMSLHNKKRQRRSSAA